MVRELNVVAEVGDLIMKDNEGAFQDGEGRIVSGKGKERAREPDHRMWGVRALVLKEGRDGTKGEDDYQVSWTSHNAWWLTGSYWNASMMMERSLVEIGY